MKHEDDDRLEILVLLLALLFGAGTLLWGAWYLERGETPPVQRTPYVAPWEGFSEPTVATTAPQTVPTTTVVVETPRTTALTAVPVVTVPVPVVSVPVSFPPVKEIAQGLRHACQISNGKVFCAGSNGHNALGVTGVDGSVTLPGEVTDIAAGQDTSCAIVDGVPHCWGWRTQVGAGSSGTPRAMGVTGADKVYAGDGGTLCALDITAGDLDQERSDDPGTLYCWGEGISAAGLTGRAWSDEAVVLATSPDWDDVAISGRTVCTLTGEVALTCYGDLPGGSHSDTGTILGTNKAYRHIKITTRSIGDVTVCATREDGTNVQCF
jgi:hypothetical protein